MTTEIFDSIFAKDNAHTIDLVNSALQSKAFDLIQQRKVEVAQNIFNQEVSEDEE
jgi:hypothetical protein